MDAVLTVKLILRSFQAIRHLPSLVSVDAYLTSSKGAGLPGGMVVMGWYFCLAVTAQKNEAWATAQSLLGPSRTTMDQCLLSFLVQAAGALMANDQDAPEIVKQGLHAYMGGIGLQQFIIFIYTSMAIRFQTKVKEQ
ncbi:hypothetical protein GJ744_005600 [Endocarpon pusillum]|uniref:Uncharacterized protein n=1 Tax=Endocarpon pusillum TaxID=364733 RepID=A0A8H7APB4_9EURO|nr:hypothetical protein GJ744_005600 [Endocarpon pusillum]